MVRSQRGTAGSDRRGARAFRGPTNRVSRNGAPTFWAPTFWAPVLGVVVCVGLTAGPVSPSWAAEPPAAVSGNAAVAGAFGLGSGLQGEIDPRSGGFSVDLPLGGVSLSWDSTVGDNRFGYGQGWSISGLGHVDTRGGVRVFVARGTQGVYQASETAASGLAGYEGDEVRFAQSPGVLPARADGLVGERPYAFVLRELGGMVSFFDAEGNPITKMDAHERRADWEWGPEHQLLRVVAEDGVTTSLDWQDPGSVVVSVQAGHTGPVRPVGTVELSGGRLTAVADATGARTSVNTASSGLITRISAASGAVTDVTWQALDDTTTAVDRVAVVDPMTGERLVERSWEAAAGLASGWPVSGQAAGTATAQPYRTMLSDGVSRVVTEYTGDHAMRTRDLSISTPSGEHTLKQESFTYPDGDGSEAARAGRPTGLELTHTDASGAAKTVSEGFVFDVYGRVTLAADGTRYAYDAANRQVQEVTASGETLRTGYWADGDRASLRVAGATGEQITGFYWDAGRLVTDRHTVAGAVTTASYLLGAATREARTLEGGGGTPATVYAVHDRHGNTTELTDLAGTTTTRYVHTDYGVTTTIGFAAAAAAPAAAASPTADEASRYPFLYAGEYTNPTGSQHLAVRTYAPAQFGFTTPDTLPLQTRYGYGDANPITNVDPSGRISTADIINGVMIGVGFVFSWVTAGSTLGMTFAAGAGLAGAITANAASLALGGISLLAGVAGSTIATLRYIDDHAQKFLDETIDQHLEYAEYALMGLDVAASLGGVLVAPEVRKAISAAVSGGAPERVQRYASELDLLTQVHVYAGNRATAFKNVTATPAYSHHNFVKPTTAITTKIAEGKKLAQDLVHKVTKARAGDPLNLDEVREDVLTLEQYVSDVRMEVLSIHQTDGNLAQFNQTFRSFVTYQNADDFPDILAMLRPKPTPLIGPKTDAL